MKKKLAGIAGVAALLMFNVSAQAAITISVSGEGLTNAKDNKDDFIADNTIIESESFEEKEFSSGDTAASFTTNVGTFGNKNPFTGNSICTSCNDLIIYNDGDSPFSGRFAVDGDQYLDSNDSEGVLWERAPDTDESNPTPSSGIGFFITDPNDQGGNLLITAEEGTSKEESFNNLFGGNPGDGAVFFVSIFNTMGDITSVRYNSNDPNGADGFGIDLFMVASPDEPSTDVPVPATLGLLGVGLIGLGAALRRRKN